MSSSGTLTVYTTGSSDTVGRLLDLFGIDSGIVKRWRGAGKGAPKKARQ